MKANKYILINVVPPTLTKSEAIANLDETLSLITTFGEGEVVQIIQRRAHPHPGTYMGTGKAQEVLELIKHKKIDAIILNTIAKPTQLFKLTKLFWQANPHILVWDRVDLILHIFSKHARTAEAKLQIKLAKMRHMGPRMYGLSQELGRQSGGIGGRGIGETNVELMKRHWKDQIKRVKDQLHKLSTIKKRQLENRKRQGFKTVSIVGYTNAGKTTLFNTLTMSKNYAKDKLFATLDSAVGHIFMQQSNTKVMITDTIGFIQDLPASLIDAFKSTLMESIHADLLLHVIDGGDERVNEKKNTVTAILQELEIEQKPIIYVLNKYDTLNDVDKEEIKKYIPHNMIAVSAKTGEGVEKLKKMIENYLQNII